MNTITKDELFVRKDYYFNKIIGENSVFIHPTDTIYGLGCDATSTEAVAKLREIKKKFKRPLSVIAPSRSWIVENCVVDDQVRKWLDKLPGPYTLILKLKNKDAIAPEVNNGMDSLGIRVPFHWFSEFVNFLGVPIVTTSANLTGEDFMKSIDDLNEKIKTYCDFIVYEGPKKGKPSTIVNLAEEKEKIIKRN